ncbi:MAG: hypothetical protein QM739_12645 [Propionivibrio sp.]
MHTLTFGELWMNWLKWPTLLAIGALSVGCAHLYDGQREAQRTVRHAAAEQTRQQQDADDAQAAAAARHAFAAQVVGLQWLNPLMRKSYPTEWSALWTLGLAQPNADDVQVKKDPEFFSTLRPVAGIAFNLNGEQSFDGYYERYIDEIFSKLRERYFMNPDYFYSVAKGRKPRREVAGIRVEMALPQGLDAEESVAYARREIISSFAIGREDANGRLKTHLSSSAEPPDLRLIQGGPAAGFTSLAAALDFLEAHPEQTVWLLAFDAPSFPKDTQMNETGALLVLAHPAYPTGREPLAWIHRASRVPLEPGKAGAATAWAAALGDAARRGALAPAAVGYLVHDAGQGDAAASRRIGELGAGVTAALPELAFLTQGFNTPAVLGELGAGTVLTNLVLGIAYAHHKNVPVIVAGTRETVAGERQTEDRAVTAVLIRPPAHPTPFDPNRNWFRARGEGNAYLPWWSRRHDAEANRMQGWSD